MSQTRHKVANASEPIARGSAMGFPAGSVLDNHAHDWSQLVHAAEGTMGVRSGSRLWAVPPGRALWVPAGEVHAIRCVGRVEMRTIYLPAGTPEGNPEGNPEATPQRQAHTLPDRIVVLPVTRLLHELILHVIERAPLLRGAPEDEDLAGVLVGLVAGAEALPLELPWPSDPRALRAARHIWAQPAGPSSIADLARIAGTSARTLERLFLRETGQPLGRWKRQARLLTAVRLLAEGGTVTDVALDVGYESTSAFVAMFRRELGVTPGSL